MRITLQRITDIEDARKMADIYFESCQHNALSLACWPRTPEVHAWWTNHVAKGLSNQSNHYLKVVQWLDDGCNDGRGDMIAWGKWVEPDTTVEERSETSPGTQKDDILLPIGADATVCNEVFGAWESIKDRIMGNRPHWYLEQLFTSPRYQRRGAGSMIMEWGAGRADDENVEAYLEASGSEGLDLYHRWGFGEIESLETLISSVNLLGAQPVKFVTAFMVRHAEPRKRE